MLHIWEIFAEPMKIISLINSIAWKVRRVDEIPHPWTRKYLDGRTPFPFPLIEKEWTGRVAGILVISGAENIFAASRPGQDAIAVKMAESVQRARFCISIQNTPRPEKPFFIFTGVTQKHSDRAQFGKNYMDSPPVRNRLKQFLCASFASSIHALFDFIRNYLSRLSFFLRSKRGDPHVIHRVNY